MIYFIRVFIRFAIAFVKCLINKEGSIGEFFSGFHEWLQTVSQFETTSIFHDGLAFPFEKELADGVASGDALFIVVQPEIGFGDEPVFEVCIDRFGGL